jgi:hypothetical protein
MSERESFEFQLLQVNEQLLERKDDVKLLELKQHLEQLIAELGEGEGIAVDELPTHDETKKEVARKGTEECVWNIGQTVECLYSDGLWYEAVVVGATGSEYEVAFTGYNELQNTTSDKIREPKILKVVDVQVKTINDKQASKKYTEKGMLKKKKKKKTSKRDEILNQSQNDWKSFTSKVGKDGRVKKKGKKE